MIHRWSCFRCSLVLLSVLAVLSLVGSRGHASEEDGLTYARALGDAFAEVVERVGPATVYIRADKGRPLSIGMQQLIQDYDLPHPPPDLYDWSSSTGSGVIVREDGLVLTNHHVISGATSLTVTLWDKRSYPATLVGSDPRTDIAVLRIGSEGPFPTAPIGDSDAVKVGHWVLAVGHPFDFQFTVTAGIVSARGRRNIIPEEIQDYIQTDAAVNPGSSGGPLFNVDGQVIGINTAIYTPANGAVQHAGISFAIPSNMAWRIAWELLTHGRVVRAGIGVSTRDALSSPEHPRPGAEITKVIAEGPAERAGLRRGDVILTVNDEPIGGSRDLRGLVLAQEPGAVLQIVLERSGEERQVALTTVDSDKLGMVDVAIPSDAVEWAGMTLVAATDERMAEFGVALPEPRGLLVMAVVEEGSAARAGLAPGDVLLRVQQQELDSTERLLEVVSGRRSALVWFWRSGAESLAAVGGL